MITGTKGYLDYFNEPNIGTIKSSHLYENSDEIQQPITFGKQPSSELFEQT